MQTNYADINVIIKTLLKIDEQCTAYLKAHPDECQCRQCSTIDEEACGSETVRDQVRFIASSVYRLAEDLRARAV